MITDYYYLRRHIVASFVDRLPCSERQACLVRVAAPSHALTRSVRCSRSM